MLGYSLKSPIFKDVDKVFKVMNNKVRISLSVISKLHKSFPETRRFIDKAFSEACWRECISVDEVFFIVNNSC